MKTTRKLKILSQILFFFCNFFIVVFFSDGFSGPFFFNRKYRILKYILCFIVPVLTTLFNILQEKSLSSTKNSSVIIISSFVVGLLLFNLLGIGQFLLSETATINHIAYALVCVFSIFLTVTLCAYKELIGAGEYEDFFRTFFIAYAPMMITVYFLFYVNYRDLAMDYSVNLIPFKGEIRDLLFNREVFNPMRSLGNVAFYTTVFLAFSSYFKKHCALLGFAAAFAISVLSEIIQGVLSFGDADIDDVLLNSFGALIGVLIYKYLIEKIRRKNICSE